MFELAFCGSVVIAVVLWVIAGYCRLLAGVLCFLAGSIGFLAGILVGTMATFAALESC